MAPLWVQHSPKALELEPFPSILAEMYSFAIACAQLSLRHQTIRKSFITTPDSGPWEPWKDIDFDIMNLKSSPDIPILHYCQGQWIGESYEKSSYRQGGFNFHKGHVPKDFLEDCDYPLLVPPPINNDREREGLAKDKEKDKKYLWMLYWTVNTINEGVLNYKRKYCPWYRPTYKIYMQEDDPMLRFFHTHEEERMWFIVAEPGEEPNYKGKFGHHYRPSEILRVPEDWDVDPHYDKSWWRP